MSDETVHPYEQALANLYYAINIVAAERRNLKLKHTNGSIHLQSIRVSKKKLEEEWDKIIEEKSDGTE